MFGAVPRESEWETFPARGYSRPVSGIVFSSAAPPRNGMPVGSVDTGCIDIEADGTLGFCTVFNSHVPRRGPLNLPFLGVAVGRRIFVLTTKNMSTLEAVEPYTGASGLPKVDTARGSRYWGHYPAVDMEFEIDEPLSIGVRAFAPFLPGDEAMSNTPGAVFDVHMRNAGGIALAGRLAFSFPGPTAVEAGFPAGFTRKEITGGLKGVTVTNGGEVGYTLAVRGEGPVTTGACLGVDTGSWASLGSGLPGYSLWHIPHRMPAAGATDPGASLAVDFSLAPGEERTVRFLLSWYSPTWMSGGSPDAEGRAYTHMYATRYRDSEEVARLLARTADQLLSRIIAWQEVIYTEQRLPVWLRDSLVNTLYHITEDGLWATARPPIGPWCRTEDGLFGMLEDPRNCPQIECLPCSFYGNIPLVYFFPRLALSTLRGESAYQHEDGAPSWLFGGPTLDPQVPPWAWIGKAPLGVEPCEFASPCRGYQFTLNGPCLVDMIDRLCMRTGSDEIARELYPAVKKATVYMANLRPEYGPRQIISMPTGNVGGEWMEGADWFGMTVHAGGIHLAQVLMAERLARRVGDEEFAAQCRQWFDDGSRIMEEEMWTGTHYLLYNEPETGRTSNLVMGYALDGEWMARQHGLPGVFRPDRVVTTLETISRTCFTEHGALIWASPRGGPPSPQEMNPSYFTAAGIHIPSTLMLAMSYLYEARTEQGLEIARRAMHALCCRNRSVWDTFIFLSGETGGKVYGNDYYQNMVLWSLPAALEGGDLAAPCRPGGLVDRMIRAATAAQET